ncbi:peptide-methionine (S)-S-oxide reductase [Arenibacter algicola]|jgi:peptide-methionine (S)-S-oxide reductase|uniref:Peptide methionine sulfoxide reductase MsrA n=1 Tax=Arenibacter algicola TaxID=616991 RepID=A0A221V0Y8_9FLAO|nr:peptide-methionine (S)-S-oxide reductase MsrA [Arenibacter algicola]ASO06811.1 peptide methionine sulfoxide reductase MsrA 2 [Arenibacter algicola]MDX1760266.1 peptide-methionine (S)-S-oxide reductase MsrA [Arenibacter algicola]|tara:strand:+ start:591 stop:1256 length:666 start_codon:yes stop_codon:yes gene_type:complete
MRLLQITLFTILGFSAISCQSKTKSEQKQEIIAELTPNELQQYETAYFASGCFWCVEAIFESVKGVKEVVSGYSGGKEKNPTYEDVGYGRTTHAEAVEVYYDPKLVSFETLVKVFFGSHDPTTLNRQGPDKGAQYRSIAFYKNDSEKKIINDYISQLQKEKVYSAPIVTEVKSFKIFYDAEDYHQDYEKNNPNNSYILNVSVPRLKRFQAKFPELLKDQAH